MNYKNLNTASHALRINVFDMQAGGKSHLAHVLQAGKLVNCNSTKNVFPTRLQLWIQSSDSLVR